MSNAIIITGGGIGSRMHSDIPKQFIEIAGKPIISYTIDLFYQFDKDIVLVVVIPKGFKELWFKLQKKYFPGESILHIEGGNSRFESVKKGLSLLNKNMIIGVHDAVRPMVSLEVITRCYETAARKGNAVPVIPVNESFRKTDGEKNYALGRESLRIVQTPQVFNGELLIKAYSMPYEPVFTDDSTVVEKLGTEINLVQGNPENIKITTPFDLIIAENYLKAGSSYSFRSSS